MTWENMYQMPNMSTQTNIITVLDATPKTTAMKNFENCWCILPVSVSLKTTNFCKVKLMKRAIMKDKMEEYKYHMPAISVKTYSNPMLDPAEAAPHIK